MGIDDALLIGPFSDPTQLEAIAGLGKWADLHLRGRG
jgi:hypothetical protein